MTVGLCLFALACLAWIWAGSGERLGTLGVLVNNLQIVPLNLGVAWLAWRGSRQEVLHAGVRRALRYTAYGFACVAFGSVVWTSYAVRGVDPFLTWANLGYLAYYPCTLVAFRSFPIARRDGAERRKFLLDAAVVVVSGSVAVWHLVVHEAGVVSATSTPLAAAMTLAYPVGDLVLLLGLVTLFMRESLSGNRRALTLFCIGQLVTIVADLVYTVLYPVVGFQGVAWSDAVYLLGYVVLAWGLETYVRRPSSDRAKVPRGLEGVQLVSPLPYIAAACAYVLLIVTALRHWSDPLGELVLGTSAITVIILARQVVAVRQNARLLATRAAEQAAHAGEARAAALVEHASDMIFEFDGSGTVWYASPSATRTLGYSGEELAAMRDFALIHEDDRKAARRALAAALATPGTTHRLEVRVRQKHGTYIIVEGVGRVPTVGVGNPVMARVIVNARDITERTRAEAAVRASEERLRLALTAARMVAWEHDVVDGAMEHSGRGVPGVQERIGAARESFLVDVHPEDRARVIAACERAIRERAPIEIEFRVPDPSGRPGEVRWLYSLGHAVENSLGDVTHVRGISMDITERKRLEAQLAHQAFHDPLTGLANRVVFRDRVEHALARGQRGGLPPTVFVLDLDNFKTVNDSLGHAAGDDLLVQVAVRLRGCLRPTDTIARLGGDEFAVLLEDVSAVTVSQAADRIIEAIATPFSLHSTDVVVGVSLGIAGGELSAHPEGTACEQSRYDADALLRDADLAMYRAKGAGKNRAAYFEPAMHAAARQRLEVEAELRRAVNGDVSAGHLVLLYQPVIELDTGAVRALEALVRWAHPTRGFVPPKDFIPIAEESGLVLPLERWVLHEACRQVRAWHDRWSSRTPEPSAPSLAVNISGRHFASADLVEDVANALRASGLRAESLVLELTESMFVHDSRVMLARMHELKALGVGLAIDDFGTGYSSLAYLERFPIDVLKIDKSFVDGIASPASDVTSESPLAAAVLGIGRTLGMLVVAEGIEREAQVVRLREMGCELGQGYHFASPLSVEQVEELLASAVVEMPAPVAG